MELKGKIIAVLPEKGGTSKAGKVWSSQDFVIETDGQYPKKCCFSVYGDNIKEFGIQMGEIMTVYIDIDAHEYQGRWYNSVKAFRVNKEMSAQPKVEEQPRTESPIPSAGDLPF
jgi:hypothetical protein